MTILPMPFWTAVLLAGYVVLISGCASATKPYCDTFAYMPGYNQAGEPIVAIDMENAEKLVQILTKLDKGECRIKPQGAT